MKHTATWITLGLLLGWSGCTESTAPATSPIAQEDSVEELQRILDDPDPFARAGRLAEFVPTLDDEALPHVQEILDHFRPEIGVVEFDLMLRHWATRRPEEAARWAVHQSPRLYRLNAIRTAVALLARVDPDKAVPLILQSYAQDTEKGTIAQFAVVSGWFEKDREQVVEEYIRDLGVGIARQRALSAYAMLLASSEGNDVAMRWAESLPEDDVQFKQEAFQQVIGALVWVDPASARRFCEIHCEGPYAHGLRGVLIRRQLADGEPGDEVVEWVARTAKAETEAQRNSRDRALSSAFTRWAGSEHEAAIAWMKEKLAQAEPEPWLEVLYGPYALQLAAEDPAGALEWSEKAGDEISMIRIARYWLTQDEEAAEAWLAESPLDENQRGQARNPRLPYFLPRVDPNPALLPRGRVPKPEDTLSSPTP